MSRPVAVTVMTLTLLGVVGTFCGCRQNTSPPAASIAHKTPTETSPPVDPNPADSPTFVSGLLGGPHDFSRGDAHPRDLCLPCHAPHLPGDGPAALPTYGAASVELDRGSLLCMSCHDGVIASDVFTSTHATRLASQVGRSQLGFDGLQGHPVGIEYPVGRSDYHPAGGVAQAGVPLPDGRVQCSSCHDPHNVQRIPGMLVTSNQRSRLCLSCHRL